MPNTTNTPTSPADLDQLSDDHRELLRMVLHNGGVCTPTIAAPLFDGFTAAEVQTVFRGLVPKGWLRMTQAGGIRAYQITRKAAKALTGRFANVARTGIPPAELQRGLARFWFLVHSLTTGGNVYPTREKVVEAFADRGLTLSRGRGEGCTVLDAAGSLHVYAFLAPGCSISAAVKAHVSSYIGFSEHAKLGYVVGKSQAGEVQKALKKMLDIDVPLDGIAPSAANHAGPVSATDLADLDTQIAAAEARCTDLRKACAAPDEQIPALQTLTALKQKRDAQPGQISIEAAPEADPLAALFLPIVTHDLY